MDYKEKLRLAKEALESGSYDKETIEFIFPELRESEDERMKEAIIATIHLYYGEPLEDEAKEMIAWLEKQGEQKPNPVLDIEIPFGAKDSELQEASYYIPEGFHAEIEGNRVVIKRGEQKPAEWSEEDEKVLHAIRNALNYEKPRNYLKSRDFEFTDILDWLKSLKDRVQPRQEWSEEDIEMLNSAISFVEHSAFTTIGKGKNNVIAWLKSLKDRVLPQTTWKLSDELDETSYQVGVKRVLENPESYGLTKYNWKPSDEQMEAVRLAAEIGTANDSWAMGILKGMYQDLKKLREK